MEGLPELVRVVVVAVVVGMGFRARRSPPFRWADDKVAAPEPVVPGEALIAQAPPTEAVEFAG